ncbi:MAG: hypothetical protein M1824_005324 [Vezdaea acicularis]|nr:MAG: hypothetical protein M1824_005324 [Vezdaea acicularis]
MRPFQRVMQAARTVKFGTRKPIAHRRYQTTDAAAGLAPPPQTLAQKMWNGPVGVKTVHFWAPVMKWAIVLAGISDFYRPAEKLSLTQNIALTATGIIWTRWCLIIKPKNYLLAAVNFFLGVVGSIQVSRILMYRRSVEGKSVEGDLKEAGEDVKVRAKGVVQDAKAALK